MPVKTVTDETLDFLLKAVPVGFVAMWASIGVVAAVILVRLRDGTSGSAWAPGCSRWAAPRSS